MKARNEQNGGSPDGPGPALKPLLAVVLIVKDEEHTIARTLDSVKPFVDRWLVVDTGSTDRTREIVQQVMEGVPGSLAEARFVDFATTRNHALELCGEDTEFVLWLDADDVVEGGDALRKFLERERSARGPDREAYYVKVRAGVTFDSARVLRSSARWRFRGVVHEVLMREGRDPPAHRVASVLVAHDVSEVSAERSRRRWRRDVALLAAALADDPNDARATFYLGLTHFWLEEWEEAIAMLDRRVELGGWAEEAFQARLHAARAAEAAGHPWNEVLERYLAAHTSAPHRAEPLFYVASHYDTVGQRALCFLFARRGFELPFPEEDQLFVEADVYRFRLADLVASTGFWLGELALGEAAARQAVREAPDDERLKQNLEFYLERKREQKRKKRQR